MSDRRLRSTLSRACLLGGLGVLFFVDHAFATCGDWLDAPHHAASHPAPAGSTSDVPAARGHAASTSAESRDSAGRPCRGPECNRDRERDPAPAPATPVPSVERWATSGGVWAAQPPRRPLRLAVDPPLRAIDRADRVFRPPC